MAFAKPSPAITPCLVNNGVTVHVLRCCEQKVEASVTHNWDNLPP